jgi:DNA modification methylase
MKEMPDQCVDLIVTDPPYGLVSRGASGKAKGGFMGKEWDKAVPPVEVWKECFRILKPGAWAFVMSIPRQDCQAKMILNLQEAGFDISYSPIIWTYATGFNKSMNISKMLDRRLGVERKVIGVKQHSNGFEKAKADKIGFMGANANRYNEKCFGYGESYLTRPAIPESEALDGSYSGLQLKPAYELVLCVQKPFTDKHRRSDVYRMLGGKYDYWYTQKTVVKEPDEHSKGNIEKLTEKWQEELQTINYVLKDSDIIERRLALTPEHSDEVLINRDQGLRLWSNPYKDTDITSSITHALATKKGISWLDDGRIPHNEPMKLTDRTPRVPENVFSDETCGLKKEVNHIAGPDQTGRFAPNLLVQDDVLDTGETTKSGVTIQPVFESHNAQGFQPNPRAIPGYNQHSDSGGFSRYFSLDAWAKKYLPENIDKTFPFIITPKPSPSEKNAGLDELPDKQMYKCDNSGESLEIFGTTDGGRKARKNIHPTVKSIKLFSYLVTIGSREGDFIYDPYSGSGTLACAATILNRKYGGAELDPEYYDIAQRRIEYWKNNPHKLTTKNCKKKQPKDNELTLF